MEGLGQTFEEDVASVAVLQGTNAAKNGLEFFELLTRPLRELLLGPRFPGGFYTIVAVVWPIQPPLCDPLLQLLEEVQDVLKQLVLVSLAPFLLHVVL